MNKLKDLSKKKKKSMNVVALYNKISNQEAIIKKIGQQNVSQALAKLISV